MEVGAGNSEGILNHWAYHTTDSSVSQMKSDLQTSKAPRNRQHGGILTIKTQWVKVVVIRDSLLRNVEVAVRQPDPLVHEV